MLADERVFGHVVRPCQYERLAVFGACMILITCHMSQPKKLIHCNQAMNNRTTLGLSISATKIRQFFPLQAGMCSSTPQLQKLALCRLCSLIR